MAGTEPSGQRPAGSPAPPNRTWEGVDLLLPLVAAVCVVLGWIVVVDYERTVLHLAGHVPAVMARVWRFRLVMGFGSAAGLGLAWLAARDARRRRLAESELERLNAELSRRVVRRTAELRARTKALREARLREQLRESEAEVAFQAGLVEAAGEYLHEVGNALASLELELLRLSRASQSATRLTAVFDALQRHVAAGRLDEVGRLVAALRETVLGRISPRVAATLAALDEITRRMSDELERRRGAFERQGQPVRYVQSFRVDLELAAVLDRLPRVAGSDPVSRDIAGPVTLRTRKHAFLTGLAALLRQALDTAPGAVAVRLRQEAGGRVVLTVDGAGAACASGPAVAAFINFLNENNGFFQCDPVGSAGAACLAVSIGSLGEGPSLSSGPAVPVPPR